MDNQIYSSTFFLLVGSKALQINGIKTNRDPQDIDIITSWTGFDLHNTPNVNIDDQESESNKFILNYCESQKKILMTVKIPTKNQGEYIIAHVAPLPVLKALKLSCVGLVNKPKHQLDLKLLEDVDSFELEAFIKLRRKEIEKRNKNSLKFLNKFEITRYIPHDELHEYINKNPIYKKVVNKKMLLDESLFNRLTHEEKLLLLKEEMIVLGLERELIYSIKKHSIMSEIYINKFLDTESSESSFWYWLAKLASPNEIKDNPIWFSNWILDNYHSHVDELKVYWKSEINELPIKFWEKIFKSSVLEKIRE